MGVKNVGRILSCSPLNKKEALSFCLDSSASPFTHILRMESAFNTMLKALHLQRFPADMDKTITTILKIAILALGLKKVSITIPCISINYSRVFQLYMKTASLIYNPKW